MLLGDFSEGICRMQKNIPQNQRLYPPRSENGTRSPHSPNRGSSCGHPARLKPGETYGILLHGTIGLIYPSPAALHGPVPKMDLAGAYLFGNLRHKGIVQLPKLA